MRSGGVARKHGRQKTRLLLVYIENHLFHYRGRRACVIFMLLRRKRGAFSSGEMLGVEQAGGWPLSSIKRLESCLAEGVAR